jgi:hypothetical protein
MMQNVFAAPSRRPVLLCCALFATVLVFREGSVWAQPPAAPVVILPDGAIAVDVPPAGGSATPTQPTRRGYRNGGEGMFGAGMFNASAPYVDADAYYDQGAVSPFGQNAVSPFAEPYFAAEPWTWTLLPDNLIYKSYLAGAHEPRIAGNYFYESTQGWLLDVTLGGRVGILRYGTTQGSRPDGWQIDIEGAAFPRLDVEDGVGLLSTDYRFGIPLTYGQGPWRFKFAYYHLSSHMADELIISDPTLLGSRINFSRDAAVLGAGYYVTPGLLVYGEAGYAFAIDGGTLPWEFQMGVDFSPVVTSFWGAPFAAINAHLREELDYSGNLVAQLGWQWRGETGHTFRAGAQYYNGFSNQFEFFRTYEQQIGAGLWYDF